MKKILFILWLVALLPGLVMAADLKTLDKAQFDDLLRQEKGKVVLLNFFATWCPPCRVEIPELAKLRSAYPEKEVALIGLSVDENTSPLRAFIKENGINYPVYLANREITDSLGITSVPHNTFYAKNGSMVISEPGMADMTLLKQVVDDLLAQKN